MHDEREPGPPRVLVVDDEPVIAEVTAMLVALKGFETRSTTDPWEALEWICSKAFQPDVLLTDIDMPEVTGCDLATLARTELPKLPLLFASGRQDDCGVREGHWRPPCEFLPKPYAVEMLHEALDRVVQHAHDASF